MNQVAKVKSAEQALTLEQVLIGGDLSRLTVDQRGEYYLRVCQSVGLNPLTQPFAYIVLNNKLTLYALRNCTDQLRTIHKVSVTDLSHAERDGVFVVTVKVQNGEGRTDMATGAVNISSLKGEALANAMMKAETKAKRRATLSICGLGLLDETEVETLETRSAPAAAPLAIAKPADAAADPETGEVGPRHIDPGDPPKWITFGGQIIAGVRAATTLAEVDQWQAMNAAAIKQMEEAAPKAYGSVKAAFDTRRQALDTPRLSEADSAAALKGLLAKLVKTQSLDSLNKWAKETADSRKALTDADRAVLDAGEDHHREALIPPDDDDQSEAP